MLFHAAQNSEEVLETIFPFPVGTQWELASTLVLLAFCGLVTVYVVRHARSAPA